jgi:hypothetical protein
VRHRLFSPLAVAAYLALFVLPGVASAENNPQLTFPTGTLLAPKAKIDGANVGAIKFTGNDEKKTVLIECSASTVTGTLTKNSEATVEATIESATTTGSLEKGACPSSLYGAARIEWKTGTSGLPWCLRSTPSMEADRLLIRGGACTEEAHAMRFIMDRENFQCTYQRNAEILGTFKTHPEDASWTATEIGFQVVEGGILCTPALFMDLTLTFQVEGKAAYIS